jgi:hypothetical protein
VIDERVVREVFMWTGQWRLPLAELVRPVPAPRNSERSTAGPARPS